MPVSDRKINAPFMLPVSEKYNEMGSIVVGKIESGRVKKGDSLLLMPNKVSNVCLALSLHSCGLTLGPRFPQVPVDVAGIYDEQAEELPMALCGDNVRIRLRGVSDEDVSPGFVLTSAVRPIKVSTQFRCDLAIVDSKNIICAGYSCMMHLHTLAEEVTMTVSPREGTRRPYRRVPH
jgi:peptide chain release factor subunit 3